MIRRHARFLLVLLFVVVSIGLPRARAGEDTDKAPRIGWEESFDNIDRWVKALQEPDWGTPITNVKAVDGGMDIVTQGGWWGTPIRMYDGFRNPPVTGGINFTVYYDDVVDFDVYRYLVIRILEKSTFAHLSFCGKGTGTAYTTGIHTQDLRSLGIKGKQRVKIRFQLEHSAGHIKFAYFRVVRELTPEEKKGLIGESSTVRDENLSDHPYHRLTALNDRAGRPRRAERMGGEWCVFRDAGTGAETWRMTNGPGSEYVSGGAFNCDGSAMKVRGRRKKGKRGFLIFDFPSWSYKLVEGGLSGSGCSPRFASTEPSVVIMAECEWLKPKPRRRLSLHYYDFRTHARTRIASFETAEPWTVQELTSSPYSSKLLFGFRETPTVFIIDPAIPDPARRCRKITLPTRLKGVGFINNETEIRWGTCYLSERRIMNLATGKTIIAGSRPGIGGHSPGGPNYYIAPYENMKLLVRRGMHPQTEATADEVKIWANWKKTVSTDYGHISRNEKWVVTDGTRGDVKGQHLMFAMDDPVTILRVCRHHTSRNTWSTNTYSSTSPDATKLAWGSDQFDDGDIHIAVTGLPAPPTGLTAKRQGGKTILKWKLPEGARENGGYRVYRSTKSGSGFVALNRKPIQETTFTDGNTPQNTVFYLVAMVEPSGLEGHFSGEAAVGSTRKTPRTFFFEAEMCAWKPPMREVLHGDAFGSRYLRMHRASSEEPAQGSLKRELHLPTGSYSLWLRGRAEDASGDWRCEIQGKSVSVRFEKPPGVGRPDFVWVKSGMPLEVSGNKRRSVSISASRDGLALDKFVLTSDPKFDPSAAKIGAAGPQTVSPRPASGLEAFEVTPNALKLRWKPSPTVNVARYDIHVGGTDDPGSLGNETIIGSTRETVFEDWGLRPGRKYRYRVVAVDSRGNRSEPVSLEATTAAQAVQVIEADAGEAPQGKVPFSIEVKEAGPFLLWAKYRPAYTKSLKVNVEIDGKPVGAWRLRAPYGHISGIPAKKKRPPRVFADKIVADGKDVFELGKGRHTIAIVLDPKLGGDQHVFDKLYASNDHGYRPKGHDPRANFTKRKAP